jgi:hypothetical protein
MTKILRNERVDEALAWAVKVIGGDEGIGLNCSAISLVDDKGDFIAVTLYSSYTGRNIDLHIAARYDTAWASRKYFQAAMELPFEVLRVARITGLIRSSNLRAQRAPWKPMSRSNWVPSPNATHTSCRVGNVSASHSLEHSCCGQKLCDNLHGPTRGGHAAAVDFERNGETQPSQRCQRCGHGRDSSLIHSRLYFPATQ